MAVKIIITIFVISVSWTVYDVFYKRKSKNGKN